jgi:hypothetical protein
VEKTAVINGVQKRFFLFKLAYSDDAEPESHLAICGPFYLDKKKVFLNENEISLKIFYEEKFSNTTIAGLFNKYIREENEKAANPPAK